VRGPDELVEAVVQVGTEATSYLRCGRGECTVVVAIGEAERLRLVMDLSPAFRVVAPVPPPALARAADRALALAEWLRDVTDGLGLEQPRLVLCPELAGEAGRFAELDGEWLGVVALHSPLAASELRRELEALG